MKMPWGRVRSIIANLDLLETIQRNGGISHDQSIEIQKKADKK